MVINLKKATLAAVAIALSAAGRPTAGFQTGTEAPAVATARPISEILTDVAGGVNATTEIRPIDLDSMAESTLYREYGVVEGASRRYGPSRVDLFRTATPFGALGLFTLRAGLPEDGSNTAWLGDGLVLWRPSHFVRVSGPRATAVKLGVAVGDAISADESRVVLPSLLAVLPKEPAKPESIRYVLGTRSLAPLVQDADVFRFDGGAEAVVAEYRQAGRRSTALKLLVVEYHTPQFAVEAMERLTAFFGSLSAEDQGRIVCRREGNFIVQATGVTDRDLAERLVSSIEYPYGVKWLKNPLLPNEDPLENQKTAQVLISTFLIIALVALIALLIGGTCGALIFVKRRRQLRAIFSDAGGMLRLDINPLPGTALPGSKGRFLGRGHD